jgi:hypothetical protein
VHPRLLWLTSMMMLKGWLPVLLVWLCCLYCLHCDAQVSCGLSASAVRVPCTRTSCVPVGTAPSSTGGRRLPRSSVKPTPHWHALWTGRPDDGRLTGPLLVSLHKYKLQAVAVQWIVHGLPELMRCEAGAVELRGPAAATAYQRQAKGSTCSTAESSPCR